MPDQPDNPLGKKPHNHLFLHVFGQPPLAADFFRSYLPAPVVGQLALDRLQRRPELFVDGDLKDRQADLLYEVPFHSAQSGSAFLYLLYEHQSSPEPLMAFRLLSYMVRVWEWHLREHPTAKRLPVVLPIVLYHGLAPWKASQRLLDLIAIPSGQGEVFQAHVPDFQYLLTNLREEPGEPCSDELMVQFTLRAFKWGKTEELVERLYQWQEDFRRLLTMTRGGWHFFETLVKYLSVICEDLDRSQVLEVLAQTHEQAGERIMTIYEELKKEGLIEGIAIGKAEGRQEGQREGRVEGKATLLIVLLEVRFGPLPSEIVDRIRAATEQKLDAWVKRCLFITKPEELFLEPTDFS